MRDSFWHLAFAPAILATTRAKPHIFHPRDNSHTPWTRAACDQAWLRPSPSSVELWATCPNDGLAQPFPTCSGLDLNAYVIYNHSNQLLISMSGLDAAGNWR